ncbi:MAG: MFS transporter, partial [Chloroflexota bacterium]
PSIFLWGFLADRLGGKRALLGVLVTLTLGTLLIARAHSSVGAYTGAAVFGAGFGAYMLVVDIVWADFFGRRHLGSIRGASMSFQLVGNASGSLVAALLYDLKGSYQVAFRAIILMLLASSVVLILMRKPRPKTVAAGG